MQVLPRHFQQLCQQPFLQKQVLVVRAWIRGPSWAHTDTLPAHIELVVFKFESQIKTLHCKLQVVGELDHPNLLIFRFLC